MTIEEFMRDIAPKKCQGWIAMDKDEKWFWYDNEPKIYLKQGCWYSSPMWLLSNFDIEPIADWQKSLRKVGN